MQLTPWILLVALFVFHPPSRALTIAQSTFPYQSEQLQSVDKVLKGLSSSSWRDRCHTFRGLTRHDLEDDRIRLAVFNLLRTEKNIDGSWAVATESDAESETLIEYVISVTETVISLNDPRSVPYLVPYVYSGMMVWQYLIENSSLSLPLVVERFHRGSIGQQHGAAITLGLMLSEQFNAFVTQSQRDSIHNELLNVLQAPAQNHIKEYVLVAFGESEDSKYHPLIEKYLLHSDPKLRIAAQSALEKLSKFRKPFR